MKNLFVIVLLVFVAGLAMILGSRLPIDSVVVVVGIGCGIMASIPTSLFMLAVMNRTHEPNYHHAPPPPQVIVISSPRELPSPRFKQPYIILNEDAVHVPEVYHGR